MVPSGVSRNMQTYLKGNLEKQQNYNATFTRTPIVPLAAAKRPDHRIYDKQSLRII